MEPISIKTKTKYAYDEIKKQIIDGKLNKGSRLIIQDLANELNISSTPVREALAKLESEGLIETQPHVGAIVTGLDVQRIREITIIRSELEHFAIRNLPRENLNEITLRLHDILEKMNAALSLSDEQIYFDLTWDFTSLIFSHCGNKYLYHLLLDLREQSNYFLIAHLYVHNSREESYQVHEQFYHLLLEGRSEEAADLFRAFKLRVRGAFIDVLQTRGVQGFSQ